MSFEMISNFQLGKERYFSLVNELNSLVIKEYTMQIKLPQYAQVLSAISVFFHHFIIRTVYCVNVVHQGRQYHFKPSK